MYSHHFLTIIVVKFKNYWISVMFAKEKKISRTFLSGRLSCTIVIPIELARKYQIDRPTFVAFEELDSGILIRKVDV